MIKLGGNYYGYITRINTFFGCDSMENTSTVEWRKDFRVLNVNSQKWLGFWEVLGKKSAFTIGVGFGEKLIWCQVI